MGFQPSLNPERELGQNVVLAPCLEIIQPLGSGMRVRAIRLIQPLGSGMRVRAIRLIQPLGIFVEHFLHTKCLEWLKGLPYPDPNPNQCIRDKQPCPSITILPPKNSL